MDWEKNRLAIGAVLLVAIVGIAAWASQKQDENVEDGSGSTAEELPDLLPDLDKAEIDEIEVHRPDTEVVVLRRVAEGEWRLAQPVDAPADMTTVNTALDKLDELAMVRIAATNDANHERLEVTDETGIRVIVRGGGSELANLLFGAFGSGATMVRPEGEDRVAAAEGSIKFAFNKDVKDWRNRRVVDVAPSDVVGISFQSGEAAWRFARGEDDEWTQAEGEAEIERFGASRVQSTVSSLARMRASNFADPNTNVEEADLGDAAKIVTLTVRESSEETGDEEGEGEASEGEASEGEETPAAEAVATYDIVLRLGGAHGEEATDFYLQREGDPNIFLVSSYLADRMDASLEDFQTPEAGEAEAPGAGGMPPGMPGMPGAGGPGGGQIPPEVMQQIQQQIQQQGGASPH
jgi:hypothetical protein